MRDIPIGVTGRLERKVTDSDAISFLGTQQTRVLATPWLIWYLEIVSRNTVKPYLLDEEDTVGTHVNVTHLAATPIGMTARFEAEITRVDGKRISFRVTAWDDQEKVGEGTHERAVIDVARFGERAEKKRVQQAASENASLGQN